MREPEPTTPPISDAVLMLRLAGEPSMRSPMSPAASLNHRDAALLAWLVIEGPTPRSRLATLLWPDSAQDAARNALRQRIFKLRKLAGTEVVVGTSVLSLADGVTHDLGESDTVLGTRRDEIGGEFDQWLADQRERLRARLLESIADLVDRAEQARDFAEALSHAQELLALEPLSEAAYRRVIRLHYLAGDRPAALLTFDRCEHMLKNEVGTTPDAETRALLRAIDGEAGGTALQPAAAVPAVVLRPPQMIGREAERAFISRTLAGAGVVLLFGEAGMGKSRLIEAVNADPLHRLACLTVAGRPGDDIAPYSLAARWLRALLAGFALKPTPTQQQDLARVLPEFGVAPPRAGDAERALLCAACESLLAAATAQGLTILSIDDLQYADAASVQLLHSLIGAAACGWLLAMRPGELGPSQQALADQHSGSARVATVHLQPLAGGDVESLLGALGLPGIGGRQQAESLLQRTGGNPLYLLETLKAALAPGPRALVLPGRPSEALAWPRADNVLRLIQQRLARLSPLAMKVTRCAAVAGQDLSSDLAAQVLGLRSLDLADAWAELEAAEVLRGTAFAHDLIDEAARALVPEAIAVSLHAEVAAFLEQGSGNPARIAAHWTAAGQAQLAVPHLQDAARRAASAGQPAEAARMHERAAITLCERGHRRAAFDAFFDAAQCLSAVVQASDPRMKALTERLAELVEDDGQRALEACIRVAALAESREFVAARQLLQQALAHAEQAGLLDVQVELLWMLAAIGWESRDVQHALGCAERALQILPRVDCARARLDMTDTGFKLNHALGLMLTSTGRYAEGEARMEEALHMARRDRDAGRCSGIANSLSVCAVERGDLAQAQRWSAQALADDDGPGGHPNAQQRALSQAITVSALAGDLGTALAHALRLEQLTASEATRNGPAALRRVLTLYFELGRRDLALKGLRALRELPDMSAVENTARDALAAHLGERVDGAALLESIVGVEDFPLRARLLSLATPACEPAQVLPILSVTASSAREQGAMGIWLSVQMRRIAALRALGRNMEASDIALELWPLVDQGLVAADAFPDLAASLRLALAPSHAVLVQTLAMRSSAWILRAASTLPEGWRENYLQRAPSLLPARSAATSPGHGRALS